MGTPTSPDPSRRPSGDRRAGAGGSGFASLALGAIGVVFGDIGTSPLYTFNSIFAEVHDGLPNEADIVGAFSLVFWTMTWITCLKYLLVVMRFSHHGEGGSLALMQVILDSLRESRAEGHSDSEDSSSSGDELVEGGRSGQSSTQSFVIFLGMMSCSLIIGDGVITPPNSVLGALNSPVLTLSTYWVVAIAVVFLLITFALQRLGSRIIGVVAGPFMIAWFLTNGALGLYRLMESPVLARTVAKGFNPYMLYTWFFTGQFRGWFALKSLAGAVLCVTGAEALYADMGHFGAAPITVAWFALVYPCLVLQYMGQAVVIMAHPAAVQGNPFYAVPPPSLQWPVFILAILAAIIASQALISGVFSILSQAHALEFVPRLLVLHTNPNEKGQVYIPEANWTMMVACVLVTIAFRTSDALAGAYGIAVSGAFIFTTMQLWWVLRTTWKWPLLAVAMVILPMLAVDTMFWIANLLKIMDSGWVPIVMALACWWAMNAHYWGRRQRLALAQQEEADELKLLNGPQDRLQASLSTGTKVICTVPGLTKVLQDERISRADAVGVFLTLREGHVPPSVRMLADSLGSLPKTIVLLHIRFEDTPFISEDARCTLDAYDVQLGIYGVVLRFGYAEPLTAARFDVHESLQHAAKEHVASYPALAPLLAAVDGSRPDRRPLDPEGNLDLDEVLEEEQPRHPGSEDEGDDEEAVLQDEAAGPKVTYVLARRTIVPKAGRRPASKFRVWSYAGIVKGGRNALDFFGLTGRDALEVAEVVFL